MTAPARKTNVDAGRDRANAQPIVEVARALGIKVFHRGNGYWARCLQNGAEDRMPSLKFRLETNTWKCFSCDRPESDVIELVQVKRSCGFREALRWLQDTFKLLGDDYLDAGEPGAQWAGIRGVDPESVRAFGVETQQEFGHSILHFPMRFGPGQAVVGYQKRRADNKAIAADGRRSICDRKSQRALFIPLEWPTPDKNSHLLIVEGEADAIAAHSAGFRWVVGTPGTNWNREVRKALEALRLQFTGEAVLVMDGDVPDQELLERAYFLNADLVRVPLYVSPIPQQRDLNKWLQQKGGAAAIRSAVLNTRSFTVIFDDAGEVVLEAVRRRCGLKAEHVAPLRAVVSYALRHVLPHGQRQYMGVKVSPGQWVFTRQQLMDVAGVSERTIRTLISKLELAGFWTLQHLTGKRGILATVISLSAYLKLTGRDYERSPKGAITYDGALTPTDRQEAGNDRQGNTRESLEEPCGKPFSGKTVPALYQKTNRRI